jgi:hypothetical protein
MSSCALETLRSDVGSPSFDYEHLAPDIAEGLRTEAARLRHLITKTTADMIEIGRDLISIKARLEHGQFADWVEREIGIGVRTAQATWRSQSWRKAKTKSFRFCRPPRCACWPRGRLPRRLSNKS